MLYIVIAIFIFGLLIATHELGHFAAAKLLGVKVNEFSIGMGPALFNREKGDTLYSIRVLPIGGYCAMEGEDDDSADPHAFGRAAGWKKFVILVAGAAMNFVTGLLILMIMYSQAKGFWQPTIGGFIDGYGLENCGLQAGDVVVSLDGHRIYSSGNLQTFLARADDKIDWVVERDGQKVTLRDVYMPLQERVDENGTTTHLRGFSVTRSLLPATFGNRLLYSWYGTLDFVRMIWMSLGDILAGAVGIRDLSGPVGIVDTMKDVGSQSETPEIAAYNLAYLAALIAVNLAVMNLLPLPALDGGRILFLLLNGVLYLLYGKKISPEHEGYVHMAGMAMLLTLMLMVTLSDVGKLFGR